MLRPSDDGKTIIEEWLLKKIGSGVITKRPNKDIDLATAEKFNKLEVRPFQNIDCNARLLAQ